MKISYFKTIIYSFYSDKPYAQAYKSWKGRGIKYLLLVTAMLSIFTIFGWMQNLNSLKPKDMADIVMAKLISRPDLTFAENLNRLINILSQFPEIKIENGAVKASSAEIYSIKDPVAGNEIAIIDTTGKTKSLENTEAQILITDSKLITRNSKNSEDVEYIADLERKYNIDEGILNDALFILNQIPPFTFSDGKFSTKDNKLYKIYDRKNIEIIQIGDGAELGRRIAPLIAISPNEISYKNIFNEKTTSIKAADFNESLLFDVILSCFVFIKKIALWGIIVFALPLVILTTFLFNLIMLIFYAFIGHSFIKIRKLGQFEYNDLMRISAIAITPMLTASALLPQLIPSQGIVYFLIAIGYLYYAILAVTEGRKN
jgi:hypothetical protein